MFQTGYLTIQEYNQKEDSYRLDFPNREVRQAFFNSLLQEFTEIDPLEVSRTSEQLRSELESFDLKSFITTINSHFAKIPYHLFAHAKEGFYQAVFFTFLEKSGINVQKFPQILGASIFFLKCQKSFLSLNLRWIKRLFS